MHEVLVNRLGDLSLPRKSVVRLTGRPDLTLDIYRGRKTTIQQQQQIPFQSIPFHSMFLTMSQIFECMQKRKNVSCILIRHTF